MVSISSGVAMVELAEANGSGIPHLLGTKCSTCFFEVTWIICIVGGLAEVTRGTNTRGVFGLRHSSDSIKSIVWTSCAVETKIAMPPHSRTGGRAKTLFVIFADSFLISVSLKDDVNDEIFFRSCFFDNIWKLMVGKCSEGEEVTWMRCARMYELTQEQK